MIASKNVEIKQPQVDLLPDAIIAHCLVARSVFLFFLKLFPKIVDHWDSDKTYHIALSLRLDKPLGLL